MIQLYSNTQLLFIFLTNIDVCHLTKYLFDGQVNVVGRRRNAMVGQGAQHDQPKGTDRRHCFGGPDCCCLIYIR